jgi:signal transduction histidine kinase
MDVAPEPVEAPPAAANMPLEPWNGSPRPSAALALRLALKASPAGSAQELALLLRLACAVRFVSPREGATLALRARQLARRLGDHTSQLIGAALSSSCYHSFGRSRLAGAVASAASKRCGEDTNPAIKAGLQLQIGVALQDAGEFGAAVDLYSQLLSRTHLARLAGLRAVVLNNLGRIAGSADLHHLAIRLYRVAQRVSAVVRVPHRGPRFFNNNLAMSFIRLARRAQQSGQQEEATEYAERAVKLVRDALDYTSHDPEARHERSSFTLDDTLAQALYISGRSDEAMAVVETMQDRLAQWGLDSHSHPAGTTVLAQVLLDRGDAAAAISAAAPKFVQMRDSGLSEDAMDLAAVLARAHEQLNQWREAFQYTQWLHQTTEKQSRDRIARNLNELAGKLDLGHNDLLPYLAHELRSPLASALTLLDATGSDRPQPAALHGDVRARVATALETSERVLDYARLQSLRQIEPRTFDLFAMLDDACDEVRVRDRAKHVRIVLEPSGNVFTSGDRILLLRTVVGLLDNALRYSPAEGAVRLLVEEEAYCIRLTIEDEGPGFNLDAVAGLFDRSTAVDRGQRINLGLPLAARVIALHDGALLLDNRAEGGAKVLIALPPANA